MFLVARDEKRLEEACSKIRQCAQAFSIPADVGVREQVDDAIRRVAEDGGVHTLINNAGTTFWDRLEDSPLENLERAMQVNYFGALYAVKAAWPHLEKAKAGHIGFVSSVGGCFGIFGSSSYSPGKFAMTGLAECLRMEAADRGIGVTIVFPPDTDTAMYREGKDKELAECRALSETSGLMSPEKVARQFVDGILGYRFEVFCNLESRVLKAVKALCPRALYWYEDHVVAKDRRKRGDPCRPIRNR